MMTTMILAVALTCQAPATHAGPKSDAELRAMMAQINARVTSPQYRAKIRAEKEAKAAQLEAYRKVQQAKHEAYLKDYEKNRPAYEAAEREAQVQRGEARAAKAAAQAKAEENYKTMLRLGLEQQRQQLQRMSDIERNAIMERNAETYRYNAETYRRRSMPPGYGLLFLQNDLMQNRPR